MKETRPGQATQGSERSDLVVHSSMMVARAGGVAIDAYRSMHAFHHHPPHQTRFPLFLKHPQPEKRGGERCPRIVSNCSNSNGAVWSGRAQHACEVQPTGDSNARIPTIVAMEGRRAAPARTHIPQGVSESVAELYRDSACPRARTKPGRERPWLRVPCRKRTEVCVLKIRLS